MNEVIPIEIIENKIFLIRGLKVMLDSDLAQLYDVETKFLNRAVKRNIERFPARFMFQLTDVEWKNLKCQNGTSRWGGKRKLPYVFSEHGTLMLSSVLNSKKAINVSIQIIEVFDKLKQYAIKQNEFLERIGSLEQAFMNYAKDNNEEIEEIHKAINYLLDITKPSKVGFTK